MSNVVYELAILGARLPDDESAALMQCEELDRVTKDMNGGAVGAWEYHFPTFDHATEAARGFRRVGLAFDSIQIKAVDEHSGKEPPV